MTLPYTVTLVEELPTVNDAGRLERMKVVHYKTALGDVGTVRVPVDQYSADVVRQMIETEVSEIAKLRGVK